MKFRAMTHTNMLGTKVGVGTSVLAAITAWIPAFEAVLRMGASLVAIIAGCYAIANYITERKRLKQNEHHESKTKHRSRTGSSGHHPDRMHDD